MRQSTHCTDRHAAEIVAHTIWLGLHKRGTIDALTEIMHRVMDVEMPVERTGTPLDSLPGMYAGLSLDITRKLQQDRVHIIERFAAWSNVAYAEDVTPQMTAQYAAHLSRSGKSNKTISNIVGNLGAVWHALGLGDAWQDTAPARHNSVRRDAFTVDEERRVLAAAQKDWIWHPMCLLARYTGLREGDIRMLSAGDVDIEHRCLRLSPSKTKRYGISVVLPLPDHVWNEILPRIGTGLLFPEARNAKSVKNRHPFAAVLQAAGVSGNFTFHSWRHTLRTRLAEAGVSDDIAMRICGWTQRSTAARYDHSDHLDQIRKAVESTVVCTTEPMSEPLAKPHFDQHRSHTADQDPDEL